MRLPKKISTDSSDVIREDKYTIGHFAKPSMVNEAWMSDEKELDKFIKKIEKIVRSSYEYREYIQFLKDELDMNQCAFFPKISRDDISIEIHHSPFTLYDITAIMVNEARINSVNPNAFQIAENVMKLHFEGLVGLIPLAKTVHDLVHTGDVFIPLDHVHGNIKGFYDKYYGYMTSEQLELLERIVHETTLLNTEKYNPTILERRYTYLSVEGMSLPKKICKDEEKIETIIEEPKDPLDINNMFNESEEMTLDDIA